MRSLALGCLIALGTSGCVVGDTGVFSSPSDDGEDKSDDPAPPLRTGGVITEPTHGTVIAGDPSTISIRVAGLHVDADQALAIQVLADPDDLQSWTTVAETTAAVPTGDAYRFATEIRPVSALAEVDRWPRGGVLRVRVIESDGDRTDEPVALPFDVGRPDDTVVAVVNPAADPGTWQYLVEQDVGSPEETAQYYQTINAPATLDEFKTRFGFPGNEAAAQYYNQGDLGIGRDIHCRATENPAGGVACWTGNYGTFGGDADVAFEQLLANQPVLATVAMFYTPPITAPNAVSFVVYGPDGALLNEAQLDSHGDNTSIPQNCLNCHGGRSSYNPATNQATGAQFLAFDPAAFKYADVATLSFAAQESDFRALNDVIKKAAGPASTTELIDGIFPAGGSYDPGFVPPGWETSEADRQIYRDVVAPYCRGCHASFAAGAADPLALTSAEQLRNLSGAVIARTCGVGPKGMPAAEQTTRAFYDSSARGLLLTWLGASGACAPTAALPVVP